MIWKYILFALLAILVIYIILLAVTPYIFINSHKEYEKNSPFFRWLLESSTGIMMIVCNIGVKITGKEKVPKDSRFLLVSNHRSNFDPLITWYVLRHYKLAFISKEANFHVPIWGRIIRKCCFMAIDREDPRKAMTTIVKASKLLEANEVSVAIYPEGTRSKNGVLLPFHAGSFKIAQKAGVPVVIMTIEGTETIHQRVPFRRSHLKINFVETIPADYVKKTKSTVLCDEVREKMAQQLGYQA